MKMFHHNVSTKDLIKDDDIQLMNNESKYFITLGKLIKILFENGYFKQMTIKRIKTSINNTLQR